MTDAMPGELSPADRRAELDDRLDAALASADIGGLSLARSSVLDCPDRWYGQLTAHSYNSIASSPDPDVVLSAGVALELLRGYCQQRCDLLERLDGGDTQAPGRNPTAALLAGDYLNSAAYSAFGVVDRDDPSVPGFERIAEISEAITEAFDARYVHSTAEPCSFLDSTAGALGEGAAAVGAGLAGADASRREQFARLGRGFSTARQAQRVLDPDTSAWPSVPTGVDARQLHEYAVDRREDASRVLDHLESTTDVESLRVFLLKYATEDVPE